MTRASTWLLSLAASLLACRIPNEDHCGRRLGDATCIEQDPARPFCSECEAEYDGCVESASSIPQECRPAKTDSSDDSLTFTSTSTSTSDTGDEASTETGATETGPEPECGNGIKEPGEDCDGADFGELDCADPYQLPQGMLVCVPGECVVDTSQCCLQNGELCEAGECCNDNCNAITNKCGI
ncbi:hypothetical protein [Enhygromyxa salina]|uniref:Uncharacterized protein n=1 Tax=Enhygromyxa salina TaxID=215803 RepID=A0A2S9YMU9_9BACT|nr:hypothetical protein [Enhygromyxa salina]PRQ06411.1 hypothetical protein ENSA7_38810 [Enhygromyxa salina]